MRAPGGARPILATVPNAAAISGLVPGLRLEGRLLIVAAPFGPIRVNPIDLISGDRRVQGWSSGTATDSTDTMAFARQHGIKPRNEISPPAGACTAVTKMMEGIMCFRAVQRVAEARVALVRRERSEDALL